MAKTRAQKEKAVDTNLETLKKSEAVVLADFTGLSVNSINSFRKTLKSAGAAFGVVKKRLLKIIFEREGMAFDPKQFDGQTGVIFSPKDIVETSGLAYKFSKVKENKEMFKILGGFAVKEKRFLDGAEVKKLGALPSREVLLGQLVGMLAAPIRSFLFVLNEKSKKTS